MVFLPRENHERYELGSRLKPAIYILLPIRFSSLEPAASLHGPRGSTPLTDFEIGPRDEWLLHRPHDFHVVVNLALVHKTHRARIGFDEASHCRRRGLLLH